jgi:hypothetical protein
MTPCNEDTHTDRMDVDFDISLHEYGIVRNPINNDTVFCLNPTNEFPEDDQHPHEYSNFNISIEDVEEALEEAEDQFFSFIGSDRKTEMKELSNNSLAFTIRSLNQYNGYFDPNTY